MVVVTSPFKKQPDLLKLLGIGSTIVHCPLVTSCIAELVSVWCREVVENGGASGAYRKFSFRILNLMVAQRDGRFMPLSNFWKLTSHLHIGFLNARSMSIICWQFFELNCQKFIDIDAWLKTTNCSWLMDGETWLKVPRGRMGQTYHMGIPWEQSPCSRQGSATKAWRFSRMHPIHRHAQS